MDGDEWMNRLVFCSPQNPYYKRSSYLRLNQHEDVCKQKVQGVSCCHPFKTLCYLNHHSGQVINSLKWNSSAIVWNSSPLYFSCYSTKENICLLTYFLASRTDILRQRLFQLHAPCACVSLGCDPADTSTSWKHWWSCMWLFLLSSEVFLASILIRKFCGIFWKIPKNRTNEYELILICSADSLFLLPLLQPLAGSKAAAVEFSNSMCDIGSPVSAGPQQVVQLAEDLKLALELQSNQEERETLRAQLPEETAQALLEWLQTTDVSTWCLQGIWRNFASFATLWSIFFTSHFPKSDQIPA